MDVTVFSKGLAHSIHDAQAGEALVIESLDDWVPGEPPVRIVVPSESLRAHWIRRLTRARGALLGVEVLTHTNLVRNVWGIAVGAESYGRLWPMQLAREFAAQEPVLERALGDIDDGYAVAAQTVEELVNAGFRVDHMDAVLECVRAWPSQQNVAVAGGVAPRALALVRTAGRVFGALEGSGFGWSAVGIQGAAELIRQDPDRFMPASSVYVLGYSDATCAVGDLVEALRTAKDAVVCLSHPMSPFAPETVDSGISFAQSFTDRFLGCMGSPVFGTHKPAITVIEANDPYEEATNVAGQIAADLENGVEPAEIAVVVRDLSRWVLPIRRTFFDHGVPFSTIGGKVGGGKQQQQLSALADCLRANTSADLGRWLQAIGWEDHGQISLFMDSLGLRTVEDAAQMAGVGDDPGLPLRLGFRSEDGEIRPRKLRVSGKSVMRVHKQAAEWRDTWVRWPLSAAVIEHAETMSTLIQGCSGTTDRETVARCISSVCTGLPSESVLTRADFVRLVTVALDEEGMVPMGGLGGGVVVMDAIEARGRTFERLYVLGLNRGEFPRMVREDPILPDAGRIALSSVIPDLRPKKLGVEEERFLFAQLVGSARCVNLSYSKNDARNKPQHPSSLIVNLRLEGRVVEAQNAAVPEMPPWQGSAWSAVRGEPSLGPSQFLADHLWGTQFDTSRKSRDDPSYLGSIGSVIHPLDPRRRGQFITSIEAFARCPWQTFLSRDLGVARRPNPFGPLPSLNSHLLGRVIHDVVERVVDASLDGLGEGVAGSIRWPSDSTLDQWSEDAARKHLERDATAWLGFASAIVPHARSILTELREFDLRTDAVVGGEVELRWVDEGSKPIHFRVDRIELQDGQRYLTDFKIGKPPTLHKTEPSRRSRVLELVRLGGLLQGAVYAFHAESGRGRYLYLSGVNEYPQREFVFSADDLEVRQAFDAIVREVSQARALGEMFPRVSEADKDRIPKTCQYCQVREACPVSDSSRRQAVMRQMSGSDETPNGRAKRNLWWRGQGDSDD